MFNKEFLPLSAKNIPIPSNETYICKLIQSVKKFITNVRWKAFHHDMNHKTSSHQTDSSNSSLSTHFGSTLPMNSSRELKKLEKSAASRYGLKTSSFPKQNEHLNNFENDLFDLISRIKFKRHNKHLNPIIKKINKFTNNIKKHPDIIVPADKTKNFYKLKYSQYKSLIYKELNKSYKSTSYDTLASINNEAKSILTSLNVLNYAEILTPAIPRFTLKDHKNNFQENPTIRLICPSKSDLGIISKKILDRIIPTLKEKIRYTLWQSSDEVTTWFLNLIDKSKPNLNFITFDINNYYQSISPILLNKALIFAKNNSDITDIEIKLIILARRSLLEFDNKLWTRKDTPNNFDITMGASDSAQVTDLVGLYLMRELGFNFGHLQGGLYRDDALFVSGERSRQYNNTIKNLHNFFKNFGLTITVEPEKRISNFLDLTLDLNSGTFSPYHKPNLTLFYVHSLSNHPKSIINSIVPSVSNRISKLSANKSIFDQNSSFYNNALLNSGYNHKIKYNCNPLTQVNKSSGIITHNMTTHRNKKFNSSAPKIIKTHSNKPIGTKDIDNRVDPHSHKQRKKLRRKNNIWFNPPFSSNVKTNIPKEFFQILDRSFKHPHRYSTILNKNSIKISYSTMPNIEQTIITSNNRKIKHIQQQPPTTSLTTCNCRKPRDCPLNNNCVQKDVIYACTVKQFPRSTNVVSNHSSHTPPELRISPQPQSASTLNSRLYSHTSIQAPPIINSAHGPTHISPISAPPHFSKQLSSHNLDLQTQISSNTISNLNATIAPPFKIHTYIGASSFPIKTRISNHIYSFKNSSDNSTGTSLSNLIRNLNLKNTPYSLHWSILKKSKSYTPGASHCQLCTLETFMIATATKSKNIINSKNELISSCRHKRKFRYSNHNNPPDTPPPFD